MTRALSVSSLESIERCPRLWVAERLEGADTGSRWIRIGNACHAAAEAITRAVVAGTARPLYEIAREAVLDFGERYGLAPDELHESLEVMDRATAPGSSVTWGLRKDWTARAEVSLALDESFTPIAPHVPGMDDAPAYTGRIDRLQWSTEEPVVEAWDWKTSKDWMSSEDVLADTQAQWYAFLTLAFFPGAVVVTFRRVMLRLGYTATATFVRGEPWESRIRDRMRRGRAIMLRVLEERDAAAERPGTWCRYCPRIGSCSAVAAARRIGHDSEIDPDRPREERARSWLALRAAAERLEASLRADVAERGPIPLGDGRELGMHERQRSTLRLSREEVLDRLRGLGMDRVLEERLLAPSDDAMPKLVDRVLEELVPNRSVREAYRSELLGAATSFTFDVRGVRE